MFPFDPPENIENQRFSNVFRGDQKRTLGRKGLTNIIALDFHTAQKMKFSIKDFFSKCDQIRSFLRI